MNFKILLFITLLIIGLSTVGVSQSNRICIVIDLKTSKPIAYVTVIYLHGKNDTGTYTNKDGEAVIPAKIDSILVSCIGYETLKMNTYQNDTDSILIELQPLVYEIEEVIVQAKTIKEKKKGYSSAPLFMNRTTYATGFGENRTGAAVAKYIELPNDEKLISMHAIRVCIFENPFDSTLFRFRICEVDSLGKPGRDRTHFSGYQKMYRQSGWIELDLRENPQTISSSFYLVIENILLSEEDKLQGAPMPSFMFNERITPKDPVFISNVTLSNWKKSDFELVFEIRYK